MTEHVSRDRERLLRGLDSWGIVIRPNRPWRQLRARQRVVVVVRGVLQLTVRIAAVIDLRRRPGRQVRGPKILWVGICAMSYLGIGPLAYFIIGRKKSR